MFPRAAAPRAARDLRVLPARRRHRRRSRAARRPRRCCSSAGARSSSTPTRQARAPGRHRARRRGAPLRAARARASSICCAASRPTCAARRSRPSRSSSSYCYCVASTVGLLVCGVRGLRGARVLDYAVHMGIAVQLTNVLRDVGEDARGGPHLPRARGPRAHAACTREALRDGAMTRGRSRLPARALRRARAHPLRRRRSARCPRSERRRLRPRRRWARIYRELLEELQARAASRASGRSLRLSKPRRLAIAARALLGSRRGRAQRSDGAADERDPRRKQAHLDLCATRDVEARGSTLLEEVHLLHEALPELSLDEVDPAVELFGRRLAAPLLISGMTGGTDRARRDQPRARGGRAEGRPRHRARLAARDVDRPGARRQLPRARRRARRAAARQRRRRAGARVRARGAWRSSSRRSAPTRSACT